MRNFLLLFISILVFSSISFSQITPASGQNRCQNQAFTCVTNSPYESYIWSFSGVAYSYVGGTSSTSASPTINCSTIGTLTISVIADGVPLPISSISINGQPGVPSYQNGSSFCLSNSNLQSPNAPVTAGGTYSVVPAMTGFNTTTGQFTPSVVGVNSYIVKYALPFSTTGCTPVSSLPITVNPIVTPIFTQVSAICSGGSLSALPTTSNNGITGTWSPVLNNTATTTYTFTPTAGLCATTTTMAITVNPNVTPTFTLVSAICSGASLSALPTSSTNIPAITGTWSPALNDTATTNYLFTPTAGLCATFATKLITVNPNVTPTFTPVSPICAGASLSALPTSSTNIPAITGTWSPALNNTATTNYLFTPTAGLCATTTTTMAITVTTVPNVTINYGDNAFCSNESLVLPDLTSGVGAFTGGTYSVIPSDLSIDPSTGEIDPSTSTAGGNYTVSYTIDAADGCAAVIVPVNVEINLLPVVSISYASYPFCQSLVLEPVDLIGPPGGTYSPSPFAGLYLDPNTGDINPSQSMPGLYDVDYTIVAGNGCDQVIASAEVEITGIPTAFISYPGSPYCSSDSVQQVLIEGGTYEYEGGQYSVSPNGLSIDVNTGEIDPSSSIAGTYIVTYTTPPAGGCASVSDTTIVKINGAPYVTTSTIASTTFCDGGNVNIHLDAGYGNLYQWYIIQGVDTTEISGAFGSIPLFSFGINYNATITGNYFCEVIDHLNGCSTISDATEVTVYGLPSIPTITGNAVFCQGSVTTLASSPAVDYLWSTGATTSNLVVNTAGIYSVTVTNAEGCDSDSDPYTVNMTPLPDPTTSIIYESLEFCKTVIGTKSVTQTGTAGGTYSANNPGLSINAITGAITPSLSQAGTYTVIYTIAASGGCAALNAITTVKITTAPSASISYASLSFCKTVTSQQPVTQTGTAGGLYTSTAGLSINASTGAITPSTSTAGTYTVTYTIDAVGGCAAFSTTVSVTIIAAQSATISYPSLEFCKTFIGAQSVTQNGTPFGVYSSFPAGLSISPSTGAITPSLSTAGTYTVTYTNAISPSGCSAVSTTASVTITAVPSASISYASLTFCQTLGGVQPVSLSVNSTTGGTYSSSAGLTIDAITGAITPSTSTAGAYTVTYTIAALGGCAAVSTTANVTIIAAQSATISYPSSPFCKTLTAAQSVTQNGSTGGVYSSFPAGLSISPSTGAITPSLSQAGTYTVTYTNAAAGSCIAASTTTTVTITGTPTATISYTGTPFCSTLSSQPVSLLGTYSFSGGTYSFSPPGSGLSINILTGVIDPSSSIAGNYSVVYTTQPALGCAAVVSLPTPVTITTAPSATISYTNSPFCKTITTPETVSRIGDPGGTYSAPLGLSISASTGAITPSTSTPGTYNVTYTFAASAGCPLVSTNASVIITAAPSTTISYLSSPFCKTLATEMLVSQSGQTGGTYSSSPTGLSINASTGAITPSTSTAGTYTVTYTLAASGGCAAFSTTTNVTITSAPSASISYSLTPYCKTLTLPQPVSQTGTTLGTYSSLAGLSINASTGAITPSTSTAGTYPVTYTIAASGGCAAFSTTTNVIITAAPSASISYANASFCNTLINAQLVSQSGTTGGTYSANPTGLTIIDPNTGAINPSTSTAGTYTVTYTIAAASGCAAVSTTTLVTITTAPSASISYVNSPFCKTLTSQQSVSQSGQTGGTYSSTSGLIINGTTGAITPSTSTPGTYTVTYTLAASSACAAVTTTTSVTITTAPNASINYLSLSFCNTLTNQMQVTLTGTTGGTYSSSPAGLIMDPNTGAITPNTSTPATYLVTYTIAPTGSCAEVNISIPVTIKAAPSATINYPSSPWCNTLTLTQPVIQSGTTGGVYSSTPPGLSINSSSGSIALATSAVGSYTVSYTMPAAGGCSAVTTTTPVAIIVAPSATISYANPTWCNTLTTIQTVSLSGTTGGTYSSTTGLNIDQTTGAITPNLSSSGSYTVTYTIAAGNGCAAVSTTTLVTITPAPVTSISYSSPFCQTLGVQSVDGPGTTGGTYSSTSGLSINANTGAINPSLSTAGTYIITYTLAASAGCAAVIINPNVTITAAPSASISYVNSPFCKTLTSPESVIITGTSGGTYSASPPGLNIDSNTGAIIPSTSIAGTYIVTYTLAPTAGCAAVNTTANVTITPVPSATISYLGSPFCQTLLTEVPVIQTGTTGGVYTTIPVGLSINSSTGAITPSLSTAGTYPVTYTIAAAGGCSELVATQDITIIAAPSATISYPGSPFCKTLTTAPVTQSGTIGGTYSSTTGLSINATTGAINPSLSTAGTYTVTYTIAATGPCATVSTTTSVTITTAPSATISYPSSSFCNTLTTALPVTQSGTTGGTYSSTTGLSINASTGAINPSTSTGGTYTVTYTIAAASGCSAVSTTASVTIIAAPSANISYASLSFCNTITSALAVILTGTPGGAYSSNASGLSIDQTTGAITPSTSTAGTYIVTYTLPATSPCAVVSSTASVTITTAPSATISYPPSPWCNNLSNVKLVSQSGTPGGTYSSTVGLSIDPITGTITPSTSIPGTYTVTYTIAATGPCALVSTTASVTISAPPSATINYIGSPDPIVLCPGDSISLTAAPSGMTYSWNSPTGPNLTQFLQANTSGSYSVVVTDPFTGCSAQSTSIPVSIQTLNTTPASVVWLPTPLTICPNSSISITGVTTDANLYSWTLTPATMGNLIGASTLTPQFTSTGLSGTATLTLNTTINHACNSVITSTQSIEIMVNSSQPTLSHAVTSGDTNQVLCSNNPIIPIIYNVLSITGSGAMTTTVLINGSSSNPYNGISWSVSGTVVTISGTPTFGTYTYVISSVPTGPTGCVATTKTGTIVSQPASLILSSAEFTNNQIICIGNSIVPIIYSYTGAISAIDLPPGVTAVINTANGTYTLSGTPTVDGYFNYAITTETPCGFETLLGEITVVQNDPSMIGFGGADQTISLGGSVELVTNGTSISNYNWSPSSGLSSSTISNPFASPVTSTTYTVTAQDAFGCTYTDDIIVNVLTDYTLTIPSLITPNGDGANDFWEIPESLFYPNTSVLIINREGQEVYKSSSYDNTWNGTFDGKLLPEATYYYFIQFPNSEKTHKGPITILRSIK